MKKIAALSTLLSLFTTTIFSTSYTDSMTFINNIATKGTVYLTPDPSQQCVAGFSTSYIWGQPLPAGKPITITAQTADLDTCTNNDGFNAALWQYDIYYIPPQHKNAFYLGAIGTFEMGAGPSYSIINTGDSWFTLNSPISPSTTTTLTGTPPEISFK